MVNSGKLTSSIHGHRHPALSSRARARGRGVQSAPSARRARTRTGCSIARREPRWLARTAESRIYNEFFVAVDDGIVRGGYALKTQEFFFPDGQIRSIGYYHHPLSEGIVNQAHAMVGTLLLRDAMQRAPLLYCLGMDGYDHPLPQMLVRLGWAHCLVPFFFRMRESLALSAKYADPALVAIAEVSAGPRGLQRRRMGRLEAVPGLSRFGCAPVAAQPSAARSRASIPWTSPRACSPCGNRHGRLARSRRCGMPRLCALCILRSKRISRAWS